MIATLATQPRREGIDVVVVTGDRDAYQLVRRPAPQGALQPARRLRLRALRRGRDRRAHRRHAGAVPRVRGAPRRPERQPSRASRDRREDRGQAVTTYGDLEGIFDHLDELPPKQRQNLGEARDRVFLNREMSLLRARRAARRRARRSPPGRVGPRAGAASCSTSSRSARCCRGCSRRSARHRRRRAEGRRPRRRGRGRCATRRPVLELVRRARVGERAVRARAALGRRAGREPAARRSALARPTTRCRVRRRAMLCATPTVRAALDALVAAGRAAARRAPGQGADARARTSTCARSHHDTAVMAYLLDPAEGKYLLEDLALRYLSVEVQSPDAEPGTLDFDGDAGDRADRPARRGRAAARRRARRRASRRASSPISTSGSSSRSCACSRKMETRGIRIDREFLDELRAELAEQCDELVRRIHAHAGEEFNVNSTPQLRTILFEKLGLIPVKKTKTGPSTDADSLQKMADEHPIVEDLLRYREVEKLRSTYADALPPLIARRRSHPRHVQADRHHHRPHLERGAEPAERAGAHRRRPRDAARVHRRPTAGACSPPTTRRSSCACSRTSPRTPA